jgi:ATP-dependent Clp protease ATP-binding subunit ClpC
MATLHVRNFPDGLYEQLRATASASGRSIGAEAVNLIDTQLKAGGRAIHHALTRRRRSAPATPFEHFSPRARQVVVDAQDEARELGHDHVGCEHLLLALARERTTLAARALESAGLDHAQIRGEVEEALGRGEALPTGLLPFTPGAKKALELSLRESLDMSDPFIGPEHVLLGIAREGESVGARILADRGQDAGSLRRCVRALVLRPHTIELESRRAVRVVELEGDPAQWEARMNEVAAAGYELVQIVDRRAIFQAAGTPASMAVRRLRT